MICRISSWKNWKVIVCPSTTEAANLLREKGYKMSHAAIAEYIFAVRQARRSFALNNAFP